MYDADGAVGGVDGEREGHLPERRQPARRVTALERADPVFRAGVGLAAGRLKPAKCRPIVIAEGHGFEPVFKPVDGLNAVRAAVDEIPDAEQAIAVGIEAQLDKRAPERPEAACTSPTTKSRPCGLAGIVRTRGEVMEGIRAAVSGTFFNSRSRSDRAPDATAAGRACRRGTDIAARTAGSAPERACKRGAVFKVKEAVSCACAVHAGRRRLPPPGG